MPDWRNPRHGASRKKSEIGSLFCRFYLVKRSFWRSKTAKFFACGELSHCKYPLWCYCTISPLIIRLPITFWISEGPETHIITKLESNPNLREGGSVGHLHQIKGGVCWVGGGLLSVYLLMFSIRAKHIFLFPWFSKMFFFHSIEIFEEFWSAAGEDYCPKGLLCRGAPNLMMCVCLSVCLCVSRSDRIQKSCETGFGVPRVVNHSKQVVFIAF